MMHKVALFGSIGIYTLSIVFHLLVIIQIIPSSIVWGGRLTNQQELFIFESISIVLNVFFLLIMLLVNGSIKVKVRAFFIRAIVWLMSCLFILNTLGNLIAKSSIETIVFTPITIILSVFSLYLPINFNKIYHS
jgi:hypothetical protein